MGGSLYVYNTQRHYQRHYAVMLWVSAAPVGDARGVTKVVQLGNEKWDVGKSVPSSQCAESGGEKFWIFHLNNNCECLLVFAFINTPFPVVGDL